MKRRESRADIAPTVAGVSPQRPRTPSPLRAVKRRNRRRAASRRRAGRFTRQRALERMNDERAHQSGIAKAHLGFGRMHVDVDLRSRQRYEQCEQRMSIAWQIIGVGGAHRAQQQFVTNRPAINK